MNTFLHLLTVAGFLVVVWYLRLWLKEIVEYKYARRQEIKRRLQVEHKQEEAFKAQLRQTMDDRELLKLYAKYGDERHKRAIYYVITDMFEHEQ